jgi:hypothetical protein
MASHMGRINEIRQLCRLKGAQGRLAALEGRMDDAVRYSLETIHLAQNGTRGGFINDTLNGFASESYGTMVLARNRDKLSTPCWSIPSRSDFSLTQVFVVGQALA